MAYKWGWSSDPNHLLDGMIPPSNIQVLQLRMDTDSQNKKTNSKKWSSKTKRKICTETMPKDKGGIRRQMNWKQKGRQSEDPQDTQAGRVRQLATTPVDTPTVASPNKHAKKNGQLESLDHWLSSFRSPPLTEENFF